MQLSSRFDEMGVNVRGARKVLDKLGPAHCSKSLPRSPRSHWPKPKLQNELYQTLL
jgi:hypothetical protein